MGYGTKKATGPALFGLHYHLAKLRGQRKDAPAYEGVADWARRLRTFERARPYSPLRKILSPENAVSALQQEGSLQPRSHALAALGEAYWLSEAAGDRRGMDENERHVRRLAPGVNLEALRADGAEEAKHPLSLVGDESVPEGNHSFNWESSSIVNGVTQVSAKGEGPRKEKFDYFANLSDPRNWSKNFNPTFAETRPIEPPGTPGETWKDGRLYEEARLQLVAGDDLTMFRDILSIDYIVNNEADNPTLGKLSLTYSLSECLSSTILGAKNQGGLDVDSGTGGVKCDASRITVKADKGIRFSPAAAFSEVLNLVALPFLTLWIRELILGALAQKPAP